MKQMLEGSLWEALWHFVSVPDVFVYAHVNKIVEQLQQVRAVLRALVFPCAERGDGGGGVP